MNNIDSYKKTNKKFHDVCDKTLAALNVILDQSFYPEILSAMSKGEASLELRKRVMLRAIDEKWVRAVEDVLPSLEVVTRDPRRHIENKEYILPISQSKSITARSIQHLAQHVDYISEIKGDEIRPSKILNVFHEETMMTYENKFVNTLIQKLWTFVRIRYDIAKRYPQDTTATSIKFSDEFNHGTTRAKIDFSIELEQPNSDDADRNHAYSGDLWRRVQKIHMICQHYNGCEFAKNMGNATVRSPIIHTNAIMKNKNLRECLALWDFLESYENIGYSLIVDEHLEDIDEEYLRTIYSSMAMEYMIFRDKIDSAFDAEKTVASREEELEFTPQIVKDLVPTNIEEFNMHYGLRVPSPDIGRELTELDHRILAAIDEAIEAAEYQRQLDYIRSLRSNFRRSFLSKIIQGSDVLQDAYSKLKNAFLARKGVESRIMWNGEDFSVGNDRYALLGIRGKTLVLYLNLNPAKYDASVYKFKDVSDSKVYLKTPMMLRISNKRALNNAIKLIGEMFTKKKIKADPKYIIQDFRMLYKTDNQLLREGLIKADSSVVIDEIMEHDDKINWIPAIPVETRSRKASHSYSAKLIQSDDETKSYACEMKDTFLAYKGVKGRVSFSYEAFNKGRLKLGKITVRGKTLFIALALDPSQYDVEKYHHIDMGKGKKVEYPFGMKIRSKRAAKLACELIEEMMAKNEIAKGGNVVPTPIPPYETDEQLIARGLVKVSENGGRIPCNEQYSYSFSAAMMLASDSVIGWYSKVKNALLSFNDVSEKMGEYYETFTKDREIIARFAVKDERLVCFLAMDQKLINAMTCPSYTFEEIKFLEKTPTAICITSDFIADSICKIIQTQFAEINALTANEARTPEEYKFDHKDEAELINQGLVHPKFAPGETPVTPDIPEDSEMDSEDIGGENEVIDEENSDATEAESPAEDVVDTAEEPAANEIVIEETPEECAEVAPEKIFHEIPDAEAAEEVSEEVPAATEESAETEVHPEEAPSEAVAPDVEIAEETVVDVPQEAVASVESVAVETNLDATPSYSHEPIPEEEKPEIFHDATEETLAEMLSPNTKMTMDLPTAADIVNETKIKKVTERRVYEYPDVSLFPEAEKKRSKGAVEQVKSIFGIIKNKIKG